MARFLSPAVLLLAAPAMAEPPARTLRVVNDTSAAVNQLFVSGGGGGGLRAKVNGVLGPRAGDRDRLADRTLRSGGALVVPLRGKRCRYDLRAVLVDGRSYVAHGYDVCARGQWAISSGRRR